MALTKHQRDIVIGMILGDGFLQPTGKLNARIRLEHSIKQRDYIYWKYRILENMMQSKPKLIKRYNPIWKKQYTYYRCQSHSSPIFGHYRRIFYPANKKSIPENIGVLLVAPVTLAVWYMDDGYLYHRDKSAYIYLDRYSENELRYLLMALKSNFGLSPKILWKKKERYPCLYFDVSKTKKLLDIIKPYIIPSLKNKILPTP